MSTKDINNNRSKNGISKNILFGILAEIIAAIGFTGISNISAQDMTTTTNDTSQMQGKVNLTGTIEVDKTIGDALKSKVNINILDAITTAQNSVGPNATAKEAELQKHTGI